MKKVLAVFLALVMLLGVSACAGSPTTGTNDAEQPSTGADQSASMGAENNANKSTTEITYSCIDCCKLFLLLRWTVRDNRGTQHS